MFQFLHISTLCIKLESWRAVDALMKIFILACHSYLHKDVRSPYTWP